MTLEELVTDFDAEEVVDEHLVEKLLGKVVASLREARPPSSRRDGPTSRPPDAGRLELITERTLFAGDVMVMDGGTIHAIANASDGYTAAVHVYLGDLLATARTRWNGDVEERLDDTTQEALAVAAQQEEARLGRPVRLDDVRRLLATAAAGGGSASSSHG